MGALMAELAPAVSEMARRNVHTVGATIIYDVVLRASTRLDTLTGGGNVDIRIFVE